MKGFYNDVFTATSVNSDTCHSRRTPTFGDLGYFSRNLTSNEKQRTILTHWGDDMSAV